MIDKQDNLKTNKQDATDKDSFKMKNENVSDKQNNFKKKKKKKYLFK